jgi:hypothetical protein
MTQIFALALISTFAIAIEIPDKVGDDEFNIYVARFNKHYVNTKEYRIHKNIWKSSVQKIDGLNAKGSKANFGVNFTSDFDAADIKSITGLDTSHIPSGGLTSFSDDLNLNILGETTNESIIDWFDAGHMHAVKDQG